MPNVAKTPWLLTWCELTRTIGSLAYPPVATTPGTSGKINAVGLRSLAVPAGEPDAALWTVLD